MNDTVKAAIADLTDFAPLMGGLVALNLAPGRRGVFPRAGVTAEVMRQAAAWSEPPRCDPGLALCISRLRTERLITDLPGSRYALGHGH